MIVPPPAPADPTPVFLVDHGRHASLVLPIGDQGMVRYAYGDWTYYAQVRTGAGEASTALLWPTRAALGRRAFTGLPGASAVRRHVLSIQHLHRLIVESDKVERLRARLDSIHAANSDTRILNPRYDLEFVDHPAAYWALHNSNQVVAAWLLELGCQVLGPAFFSDWSVQAER